MSYFAQVKISDPIGPFGELISVLPEPVVQCTFPYAVNAAQATLSNTGTGSSTSWAAQLISLVSGTANNGTASLQSVATARYGAGQGIELTFSTIFDSGTALNTQIVGVGSATDGYFFGYNGTAFGILRRANSVDTWVAQTAWSVDKMDGTGPSGMTLNTAKGNVYKIQYQWLGFGMITFSMESSATGLFQVVHQIAYANLNTAPSTANPSFPFYAQTLNGASGVTSKTIQLGSFAIFTLGSSLLIPVLRQASGQSVINITTEVAVITVKNKATNVLGGTNTNRTPLMIDWISIATAGTKPVVIRLLKNTTLGGSPSYTDISTALSIAQKDIAGTTVTGGVEYWSSAIAGGGNLYFDVTQLRLFCYPGETFTFSAQSAGNADVSVRTGWRELQ